MSIQITDLSSPHNIPETSNIYILNKRPENEKLSTITNRNKVITIRYDDKDYTVIECFDSAKITDITTNCLYSDIFSGFVSNVSTDSNSNLGFLPNFKDFGFLSNLPNNSNSDFGFSPIFKDFGFLPIFKDFGLLIEISPLILGSSKIIVPWRVRAPGLSRPPFDDY